MATTYGFQSTPGGWEWPEDLLPELSPSGSVPGQRSEPDRRSQPEGTVPDAGAPPQSQTKPQKERSYKPRTCRICLETVLPTFHPPSESLPSALQGVPRVTYDSDGGRLLRPCHCKGSGKYVHEECLQQWRHADPSYGKRNYWNCPTCGFKYRLARMSWGNWLSSAVTQITLTITIFVVAVFALGFIADPIINLYLDPLGTVSTLPTSGRNYNYASEPFEDLHFVDEDDEIAGWTEHFAKGFASLGLLGFVKVLFAMGPWNWFNMRQFMPGGGRTGTTGRDRVANISWLVVILGVITFLYTVWKMVRAWSRRVLEKARERVMDVQGDDGDDDDDEDNDVG